MATPSRPTTDLVAGHVLRERWRVLEVLHRHMPWGAVYAVEDKQQPGRKLVAKQIVVPPLRKQLDERLERLGLAIADLSETPHPSRVAILDSFLDKGSFYVVMERAEGTNLGRLIQDDKLPPGTDWVPGVVRQIGLGLQALLQSRQYNAIPVFDAHMIMLTKKLQVTFISFGLSSFLRPGARIAERTEVVPPNLEAMALRDFGHLVYSLVTRLPWKEGQVLVEGELPESLKPLVLRSLYRSRADAYRHFEDLAADLALLDEAAQEEKQSAAWSDLVEPAEEPPPWKEMGLAAFALRSLALARTLVVARFLALAPRRRAAALCLLAALLVLGGATINETLLQPAAYVKTGAVVYSACEDGSLQVWDGGKLRRVATLPLGSRATGMVYNATLDRLFIALEGEKRILAVDPRDHRVVGSLDLDAPPQALVGDPVRPIGICTGPANRVRRISLRRMRLLDVLETDAGVVGTACNLRSQVTVAVSHPPAIRLFAGGGWSIHEMATPPAALRLTPAGNELWVVPVATAGPITILDPLTLETLREQRLRGRGPIDVGFEGHTAHVLLRDSQAVESVDVTGSRMGGTTRLDGTPQVILAVSPDEAWVGMREPPGVVVIDPFHGRVTRVLATTSPVTLLLRIP